MHDEVKPLIYAAKYNLSTEALAGLCKEWVDEYSGCTFSHTSDVVSISAGPLLKKICCISVK